MEEGGEWLVFGSMIGVSLSLKELGGRREGGVKGGGETGAGACADGVGLAVSGGAAGHG